MGFIDVFGAELTAMLAAVAVAYFLVTLMPVWWPAVHALRRKPRLPRPFLFVATAAALVYGVSTFLALVLFVPMAVLRIFIVPQLEQAGAAYGTGLGQVTGVAGDYGWIVLVLVEVLLARYVTRHLARRWTHLCSAPEGTPTLRRDGAPSP